MKSDINDLCEAFLAALTNAGYAVKSIENYKQVSNRFKKFCAENGYDTYTVNIGQIYGLRQGSNEMARLSQGHTTSGTTLRVPI